MATKDERGGLQPTPEDQARDALGRHKDKVETLFEQMERTLATISTSTSALRRRFENLERDWIEFESQYLEVHAREEDALNDGKHRSGSRNCSNLPRKPRRSQMPRSGVTAASSQAKEAAKLGQKNSGKKPSVKEEQAKEAALKKEAIYKLKIAAWKQSTQDKANDAKAAEEADVK